MDQEKQHETIRCAECDGGDCGNMKASVLLSVNKYHKSELLVCFMFLTSGIHDLL